VALVKAVGRREGIGYTVADRLAHDGFDVGFNFWTPYDQRMSYGADVATAEELTTRNYCTGTSSNAALSTRFTSLTRPSRRAVSWGSLELQVFTTTRYNHGLKLDCYERESRNFQARREDFCTASSASRRLPRFRYAVRTNYG